MKTREQLIEEERASLSHVEVFYIDRIVGWAFAPFDKAENQVGDADYCYYCDHAVRVARREYPDLDILIFSAATGKLRRTIKPETKL